MAELYQGFMKMLESPLFNSLFWAVILLAITAFIAHLATRGIRKLVHHDANPLPSSSIVVNISRAVIWIIGASIVLQNCFHTDAGAIVTALGVGGIAVSLGFQDTLSNLIGGLQVTFMGIVRPGDNIEVGATSGVVQDVTWRHTTIRDSLGQTVIVPNSIISKTALVHLLPANRVAVPIAVARYNTHNNAATQSLDELAKDLADIAIQAASTVSPVTVEPAVYFSEFTELGIKGKIIFQIEDASVTGKAADAVVRALAERLG